MSTDATAAEPAARPGGEAPALRDLSPQALRRWVYLSRFWLGAMWGALVVALSRLMAGPAPVPVALLVGASLLAAISLVPVHECGHWCAARLRRMAVATVVIGPLELQPRRRGLRLRLLGRRNGRRGLGGWVVALPDPRRDVRRDAMWMVAGGGLANLCFAAACVAAALLLPVSPLRPVMWPLAATHIAIGVLNLMPYLIGGHTPSDGLNLWRLSRNRYEDLPGWSLKLVLGHFAAGLPADRLDPALLRRMAAEPEPMPLMRDWLDFEAAQHAGAADDAARALARMRERAAGYSPQQRESVADVLAISEAQHVFHRALGGEDPAASRALSALDLSPPGLWRVPQVAPRMRALAAALRGDAATARAELKRSQRHADNDPVPGVAEYEAALRERIAALLPAAPPPCRSRGMSGGARVWAVAVAVCAALAIAGAYVPGAIGLHYLFKPATTLLIAAMVLREGAGAEPRYRRAIFAGLLLSTAGDAFLMLPGDWFVFGLGSFLCAHLAYLAGLCRRARPFAAAWPFLAYAAVAATVMSVLWPHLPNELRIPVIVYVAVLAAMAAQAAAVWRQRADAAGAAAAIGGACFVFSDATLAIDRFAAPFAAAQALVLVSYWAAQWWIGRSAVSARS